MKYILKPYIFENCFGQNGMAGMNEMSYSKARPFNNHQNLDHFEIIAVDHVTKFTFETHKMSKDLIILGRVGHMSNCTKNVLKKNQF